jgi:hypothetical protein
LQYFKKDEAGDVLNPNEIVKMITSNFDGVVVKSSWGETSIFYNPGHLLPHGVYFCTIKEKDGANDKSSNLTRDGIYRLSIGLPKEKYVEIFGRVPKRPEKGGCVNTGHIFTQTNLLMPHPIYAWMGWVCILSPTTEFFGEIYPLIQLAYRKAEQGYLKKK